MRPDGAPGAAAGLVEAGQGTVCSLSTVARTTSRTGPLLQAGKEPMTGPPLPHLPVRAAALGVYSSVPLHTEAAQLDPASSTHSTCWFSPCLDPLHLV
jgi:hypothetical protein